MNKSLKDVLLTPQDNSPGIVDIEDLINDRREVVCIGRKRAVYADKPPGASNKPSGCDKECSEICKQKLKK